MPEQLLTILKLCLLVLLYLFFLRVLRAVWAEVRGPAAVVATSKKQKARRRPARAAALGQGLLVVAPPDQRGRHFPLSAASVTMGRAAGCEITLDDTYASQLHARVYRTDGQLYVEDMGSTNGTYLNRQKVTAAMQVAPGDQIQVGSTVLELT